MMATAILLGTMHLAPKAALSVAPAAERSAAQSGLKGLPALPTISAVRVDVGREHAVVVQDIRIARGAWTGGDQRLFVAFGAPGVPDAFDARILSAAAPKFDVPASAAGVELKRERVPRASPNAQLLLGQQHMAGFEILIGADAFRRATEGGAFAVIRLRSVLDAPKPAPDQSRELLVRLGISKSFPLTVERIDMTSNGELVERAEAHLCGSDADQHPLVVHIGPPNFTPRYAISPSQAVRHDSDNLCIRYWQKK